MSFSVHYESKALASLQKLDKKQAGILVRWVINNLEGTDNPRLHGEPLKGNLKGYWRYRVGQYRIIADIQDHELVIVVINVGHRGDIYKS